MHDDYYVYVYCDPSRPGKWCTSTCTFLYEPFYVGEGRGRRLYEHLTEKGTTHKNNKIQKMLTNGITPYIFKLHEFLDFDTALQLETVLIQELGTVINIPTVPSGPLTNLMLGWRGNHIVSEETRQKRSASGKGKNKGKVSPNKGVPSPFKGQPRSEATKEKMKQGCAKRVPWSFTWLIEFEDGTPSITIKNLKAWCKDRGLVPLSLDHAGRANRFHRGLRATKCPATLDLTTNVEIEDLHKAPSD